MLVDGQPFRTVWIPEEEPEAVRIIDQRRLPFAFTLEDLQTTDDVAIAIKDMWVRGAGCIGATAGFGMWLAVKEASRGDDFDAALAQLSEKLRTTRPTAVNLSWAIDRQLSAVGQTNEISEKVAIAYATAQSIADEDAAACRSIGEHGVKILEEISEAKNGESVTC